MLTAVVAVNTGLTLEVLVGDDGSSDGTRDILVHQDADLEYDPQDVILAAGKGARMYPFSERSPKPILPILNRPPPGTR